MQVRLQDMLDSIEDEEKLISRLRSEGEIGGVLADYFANRENLLDEDFINSDRSSSLENVLNFSIMRILKLDGTTQGTKFFPPGDKDQVGKYSNLRLSDR